VDRAQGALDALQAELATEQARLDLLTKRLRAQTLRLEELQAEYREAVVVLEARVRAIYIEGAPDVLSFLVSASSFDDLIDNYEFMERIGAQDKRIARQVERAKTKAAAERRATATTRRLTAAITQSAALAAAIRDAQNGSTGSGKPSAAGFVWPVSGPVVSGFGMRWGRMHEGIDIAAGMGTPVHAAAAGTVIHAGWLGGYGNLVVLDHGDGLATAYAHASALLVVVGQSVSQGETVSLVGSTGHSTGPHLHFEVRVNGVAVDPLLYL